ncbi:MAG: hypothetical protein Q9167_008074, partial [Letrouitia subvulpina]
SNIDSSSFNIGYPTFLQNKFSWLELISILRWAVYLARYTRWEQEQLRCLYDYAHRRYNQIFEKSAKWYHEQNPGPFSTEEEELTPWEMLRNNRSFPFKPHSSYISINTTEADIKFLYKATGTHYNLAGIISRGPEVLASLLKKVDPRWRCDVIMDHVHYFEPFFVEIISPKRPENVYIPAANEEDIGVQKDDQPYGYKWAFANKSIKPGNPSFWRACDFLWYWGYAFWDEDRLQNWGFEIGGPFYYSEDGNEGGIFDRASGRQLQEQQWPTNLMFG